MGVRVGWSRDSWDGADGTALPAWRARIAVWVDFGALEGI
jgi:hypothetical protein